ncbi:MAG TPA: hypothetical protein VMV49_13900 [Candidatus Deferrimicrobium sp.]|nr:hypothetical protein [Candidatus Deferrimicrobium sp.]
MTLESFVSKLNQNIKTAQESIRSQLSRKVKLLAQQVDNYSKAELQGELEQLVDEFLMQFTHVYQDLINYVEEEVPSIAELPPRRPKKKREQKEIEHKKNEFVRPTYIQRAFNDVGLRVSKDARPMIMDILNQKIKNDIMNIQAQIPNYQKGEKKGEKKRITIKPEDVTPEKLKVKNDANLDMELDTISLDVDGKEYQLVILLKQSN